MKHLDTFTCHFTNDGTNKTFPNKEAAMQAAADYCGNNSWRKIWKDEETYIFGPGDGSTSVMVRQDIDFTDDDEVSYLK